MDTVSNPNVLYWWKKVNENKIHDSVFSYIKFIDQDQSYRQNENFKFMKLYGNYDLFNLRGYQYLKSEPTAAIQNRVTLNVVQNMIDTVVSKITKNRPKPTFLTSGGDFSLQRKAKKLTQFMEGQFDATDFYAKAAIAFQDSCIFGTGALKIFKKDAGIEVERVFIDEIVTDDREAFYGNPRQMHQKKFIHRDILKQMFPQFEKSIEVVNQEQTTYYNSAASAHSDMVLVVESWHLPSSASADDGKHAISIQNETLFEEEWKHDYFPFVFFRWGVRPLGFFGQGLAEQLQGLQLEINKILRTIQVSMHLVSVPKVFIDMSSKIVDAHLDNKIGGIIKFSGNAPIPGQLGTIPAELFQHLDRLYSRSYEIAGVSQLSAQSQKPQGLNSGKALRTYNDLESERFMSISQRYEKVFMDACPQFIDLIKDIDEELKEQGGYKVKVKGKKFLDTIKWKDVSLDEDQYMLSLFPTSALSSTPAGRLQDVQELIQAGFVSKEDALKLLDFPDLQNFYNFSNAGVEDIERTIEDFIDSGKYSTPEPYQNLQLGIIKMQQGYLYFKAQNAPDEKLELFRRWIEDAKGLLDKANMEMQKQQAMAQMQAQQEQQASQSIQAGSIPQQAPADQAVMDSQIPTDVTQPQG